MKLAGRGEERELSRRMEGRPGFQGRNFRELPEKYAVETDCSVRSIRCHPPSGPYDKDGSVTEERIWNAPRRANSCNFFKGSLIPCGEQREQEVLTVFLITSRQK